MTDTLRHFLFSATMLGVLVAVTVAAALK